MTGKKAHNKRPRKAVPAKATAESRLKQGKPRPRKLRSGKKPLSPLEVQLRKALAEMGLARARRVFAAVEASFDD